MKDPNAMVTLRTGATVPMSVLTTTSMTLRHIALDGVLFAETVALARDPAHALFGHSGLALEAAGLITNGVMHEDVRAIILASTTGEELAIRMVAPITR